MTTKDNNLTDVLRVKTIIYKLTDYAELGGMTSAHAYSVVAHLFDYVDRCDQVAITKLIEVINRSLDDEESDSYIIDFVVFAISEFMTDVGFEHGDEMCEAMHNLIGVLDDYQKKQFLVLVREIIIAEEYNDDWELYES